MPEGWKRNSMYLLTYSHSLQQNNITLRCIPMQNYLMVHANISSFSQVYNLQIDVTEYVRIDLPLDSGLYLIFLILNLNFTN